ncbi:MAG TPA: MFS transporter [Candidatus Acidoferrales bacterium]
MLVLCAINLLNFYDRQAPGALVEPMRREFGLSDTQIGLLGSMFIWIYALAGVPLGRVADVWSRKKLLAIGVTVWSALTAASGLAASFSFLVFTRLGVGVGEAVCAPVGTSWIGDLFPAQRRARILSLFMLGVPIGGALSFLLCGPIAQAWGWRTALVSAAAPAILLVPLLLLVREPARGASEKAPASAPEVNQVQGSMLAVLRIRTLWWIILSGALLNFNMYALATFLPAFMTRVHGYSVARAGVTCGIVYLIGGVCGGLLGGHFGDRVASNARNARLWMAAIIALLGAPIMFYGITRPAGFAPAALVAIAIGYGAFNTYYGPVYASIQDIVPPNQRALTMSVYFMAMYLCGASFGPLLTGHLSDYMARRAMHAAGAVSLAGFRAVGLQQAMVIMPILSLALAIVLYFGSRSMGQDVERRETSMQGSQGDAGIASRP